MEYLGQIQGNKDLVNKKWVEDNAGHTIKSPDGTSISHKTSLKFSDATPSNINDDTVLQIVRRMTKAEMNTLSTADRYGFIETTDESDETPISAANIGYDNSESGSSETDLQGTTDDLYKKINILISPYLYDPIAYKNAAGCRCKDITEYIEDGSFYKRLAGTDGFHKTEGLYLGDYIEMSRAITCPYSQNTSNPSYEAGTKNVMIAGFNELNTYQLGGTFFDHAVMCPVTHFGKSYMNTTNTTVGAYAGLENQSTQAGCNMFTTQLGAVASSGSTSSGANVNQQLVAEFGLKSSTGHLVTTNELLSSSINASGYNKFGTNSGCSNNWRWVSCQSVLMSEMEVYGGTVWSSSGYDTGNAKKQLSAFMSQESMMMPNPIYFWLKDVASSTYFCLARGNAGHAHFDNASHVYYVRPRFVLA